MRPTEEFDYVIVGAGSAGCVLADRLTEDGANTVLVLEVGGSDRSIFVQMPSALSIPMGMEKYDWRFYTEPEPGLGGRRLHTPRGKVLGGSSSINGMVYVRGNAQDFQRWESEGAAGWNYASVLPYFRRAEKRAAGGDNYRGDDGPLQTRYGSLENPLHRVWLEAGRQAGYAATDDINGYQQEGFGRFDMTVAEDGRRSSAANAYLRPAMRRPNLAVKTGTLATRILFDERRAIGVEYRQGESLLAVHARREVIVASGPINSPKLLKLSGVGPGAELAAHGIDVIADRPGVGENLQDHIEYYFQVASTQAVTLYSSMGLFARAMIGARWLLRHDGLGATNHFESGAFIRSRAGVPYPDIELHFIPLAVTYDGSSLANEHGFQAHVGPMRSKSKGNVRLASADAREKPRILFNYLSHPDDLVEFRAGTRLTREIFSQKAFDPYRGREIQPGKDVQTDDEIDAFVRAKVESAYHPSCSCKMGRSSDPMAVVDPEGRVYGVGGLRVIDSSVMPSITTGNLNAPTIMVAEKMADHVLGKAPLAPSPVPYYVVGDWQVSQR